MHFSLSYSSSSSSLMYYFYPSAVRAVRVFSSAGSLYLLVFRYARCHSIDLSVGWLPIVSRATIKKLFYLVIKCGGKGHSSTVELA